MKQVLVFLLCLIATLCNAASQKSTKQQDTKKSLSVMVAAIGVGRMVESGSIEDLRSQKAIQSAADHCNETESVIADKAAQIMEVLRDEDQIYIQPVELLEMVASIKTWLDTDADCSSLFALYATTRKRGMGHLDAYYGIYQLHKVASELSSAAEKKTVK